MDENLNPHANFKKSEHVYYIFSYSPVFNRRWKGASNKLRNRIYALSSDADRRVKNSKSPCLFSLFLKKYNNNNSIHTNKHFCDLYLNTEKIILVPEIRHLCSLPRTHSWGSSHVPAHVRGVGTRAEPLRRSAWEATIYGVVKKIRLVGNLTLASAVPLQPALTSWPGQLTGDMVIKLFFWKLLELFVAYPGNIVSTSKDRYCSWFTVHIYMYI